MNTHTSTKYKPGDRVIALRWPRNRGGVVVKFAPKRMLVRWDGLTEDTRTSTADLRPETAEDVGLRAHAAAVSGKISATQAGRSRLQAEDAGGRSSGVTPGQLIVALVNI
jgi:hypothetical protein